MNSFSQGLFVFKNGYKNAISSKKKSSKCPIPKSKFNIDSNVWLEEFENTWLALKSKVDKLQENNTDNHLTELFQFVATNEECIENTGSNTVYLRVAALLTGINKPDHYQYFHLLSHKMKAQKIAQTVFLPARDCPNVRTAIEILVSSILNNGHKQNRRNDDIEYEKENESMAADAMDLSSQGESDDDDDEPPTKLRRSQYNLNVLQSWYEAKYANKSKPKIAIIMPNFEEFKPNVIKDLTLILSNHCNKLPFVVILGVATSTAAVMKTLSFSETTRIKLCGFSAHSPNLILNEIHNDIILTPRYPFQMSSHVFEYLKGVFLFYDLTTKNFLKAVHHNMLHHYSKGNAYALCARTYEQSKRNVRRLKHVDFELIRRLPSFRLYVESMSSYEDIVAILTNDEFLRKQLNDMMQEIYCYFYHFYGFIRFILRLVKDLPNAPLGKRLSDIYVRCHSHQKPITTTEEFDKCWQMLSVMSKSEFINLLRMCCETLEQYEMDFLKVSRTDVDIVETVKSSFTKTRTDLKCFIEELIEDHQKIEIVQKSNETQVSRQAFYRNLLESNRHTRPESTEIIKKILNYIKIDVIENLMLKKPALIELFVYSDCDYVRSHLRGSSRSAIHMALTNPNYYLQCDCCVLENPNQLIATMPDISIAYKILQESGQQVNIFDWMTAFNTITNNDVDESDDIPSHIQAKFTRARAELQFLGFTKNSKRKTDHVTRTTW